MAVMVDRYSASASEIFAGAIQDYQRGLIIGHKTFGKGTVQQLDNLTSGQLKLTESKFYRVTGSGMQNRGVEPDITLPSTWDIEESGESSALAPSSGRAKPARKPEPRRTRERRCETGFR